MIAVPSTPVPARYLAGEPPAAVYILGQAEAAKLCAAITGERGALACAFPIGAPSCSVILPSWSTFHGSATAYSEIAIHEAAHCHGWPANHPR